MRARRPDRVMVFMLVGSSSYRGDGVHAHRVFMVMIWSSCHALPHRPRAPAMLPAAVPRDTFSMAEMMVLPPADP